MIILEIVVGALDALNLLGFIYYAFSGWCYLLSPNYRRRVHSRWQQCTESQIMMEVIGSLIGIAFTLILITLLISPFLGIGWFAARQGR